MPTRINAIDVGEVDVSPAPTSSSMQATRRGTPPDPLLGPYTMLLDPYIDWRSMIGGAYPSTEPLPDAAAQKRRAGEP